MLNELMDGIVQALKAAFPDVTVYDENVEQDLPIPSFSVRLISSSQALFRGQRYLKKDTVNVVYFPPEEDRNRDCNAVKEALFQVLEYITAGDDPLRGCDMEAHVEDGVLSFVVSYHYFVRRALPDDPTMDDLKKEVTVHGEGKGRRAG